MSEPAVKPASKKKLFLLLGLAVVLLGGGGGYYMLQQGKDGSAAADAVEPKLPAQYVALEPAFVANFERGSSARFLQVAVQVMTRDPRMVELLKTHDPAIRNDLLLLFGNKRVDDVSTQEAREALREAALATVRAIVEAEGGDPAAVEAVYFTSFVMQ